MERDKISMTATGAARISSVADLKAKWADLNDVDRALAVHAMHGPKVSFRRLARELGCGATLLRCLDRAAQASAEDLRPRPPGTDQRPRTGPPRPGRREAARGSRSGSDGPEANQGG